MQRGSLPSQCGLCEPVTDCRSADRTPFSADQNIQHQVAGGGETSEVAYRAYEYYVPCSRARKGPSGGFRGRRGLTDDTCPWCEVKGVPLDGSPHYSICGRYRAQRNHKVYRTGITEQTDSNTMILSQRPGKQSIGVRSSLYLGRPDPPLLLLGNPVRWGPPI